MKTIPIILLLAIFAFGQGQVLQTKQVRNQLYGKTVTIDGLGGWTFNRDELIEIDIVSANPRGVVIADIKTADAPGVVLRGNGRSYVNVIEGRIQLRFVKGVLTDLQSISLRRSMVPFTVPTQDVVDVVRVPAVPPAYENLGSIIFNRTVTVGASNFIWLPLSIISGGTLTGRLEGRGGDGKFRFYLMTDRQLTDFRNGKQTPFVFSSGEDLVVVADVNARVSYGMYYLVFDNKAGWVSRDISGTLYFR